MPDSVATMKVEAAFSLVYFNSWLVDPMKSAFLRYGPHIWVAINFASGYGSINFTIFSCEKFHVHKRYSQYHVSAGFLPARRLNFYRRKIMPLSLYTFTTARALDDVQQMSVSVFSSARAVDITYHYVIRVFFLWIFKTRSWTRIGQWTSCLKIGENNLLWWTQHFMVSRHEMHAGKYNHICIGSCAV